MFTDKQKPRIYYYRSILKELLKDMLYFRKEDLRYEKK